MFKIKISNYRNISRGNPIELEIEQGTIFIVGKNNIGKSNILKFFYEFRPLFQELLQNSSNSIHLHRGKTRTHLILYTIKNHYAVQDIFNQSNTEDIYFTITIDYPPLGTCYFTIIILRKETLQRNNTEILYEINDIRFNTSLGTNLTPFINPLKILSKTIYLGAFRNLINNGGNNYYDLSIGNKFISTFDHWKTGQDRKKNKKINGLINELKEIFGYKILNVEADPERTTLLITLNDKIHNSDEVGGGILQFIIALATIVIEEPEFLLIDEPELNLHPKLQEDFLRVLALKVKFGILATSHSIALARSSASKIYSLTEDNQENPILKKYGEPHRLSQLLGELSYSQYCELGADNILLVEGFTDMLALGKYLGSIALKNTSLL